LGKKISNFKDRKLKEKEVLRDKQQSNVETIEDNNIKYKENNDDFSEENFKEAKINEYKTKQVDFSELDETYKKEYSNYNYPSIDLLLDNEKAHKVDNSDIKQKAKLIEETLKSFGIGGRVVQINVGPTVTCFELKPARGIKVSRILNLADDLSLALATSEIR